MKKIISIFLSLTIVFVISACSKKEDVSVGNSEETHGEYTTATKTQPYLAESTVTAQIQSQITDVTHLQTTVAQYSQNVASVSDAIANATIVTASSAVNDSTNIAVSPSSVVDTTVGTVTSASATGLRIELIDGGVSVESVGSPEVDIPFYVSIFNSDGASVPVGVDLNVALISATGQTVYTGKVQLEESEFKLLGIKGYSQPIYATKVKVPKENIIIGSTRTGRISVSGRTFSGVALDAVNIPTDLLPMNFVDKLTIENVTVEVLEPPSSAIFAYVTFRYKGSEPCALLAYRYNLVDKNDNIVLEGLFNFEYNVQPYTTFVSKINIDPTWNPYYLDFIEYTFAQEDPEDEKNTIVYFDDDFDSSYRTCLYQ